jgi:hypothetical protein
MIDAANFIECLKSENKLVRESALTRMKLLSVSDRNELVDFVKPQGGMAYLSKLIMPDRPAPAPLFSTREKQSPEEEIERQRQVAREFIGQQHPYPNTFSGRGIVCSAGGPKYIPCVWVNVNMLRLHKCKLPIQIWHFGPREMPQQIKELFRDLGVTFVDTDEIAKVHPMGNLRGWESKPFSIIHSPFKEVLYLDADNVPVRDPSYLFDCKEFASTGAMFWPDFGRLETDRAIWRICEVQYRDEPEWESGQILVNKEKCWKALLLARLYNERSPFYYRHVHGDKETYHMAFRRLEQPCFVAPPMKGIDSTMVQHDPEGKVIFQHRNFDKWNLDGNKRVSGFVNESECLGFISQLKNLLIEKKITL